jgi:hypothetical protein
MTTKIVRLDREINNALAKVIDEIQSGVAFASIGERFSKTDISELPDDDVVVKFPIVKVQENQTPQDIIDKEVKEKFAQYCKRYSIIALVTACEVYLQTILLIIELTIRLNNEKRLSGEEFEKLKQEWRNQLYGLGGLSLLDKCAALTEVNVEEIINRKYFSSINRIRRCIVHRSGVISEQDVDKAGIFEAIILKPELFTEDGIIEKLPAVLKKGEILKFRSIEYTLTWKMGQHIDPNIQLCQSIGWSLIWFCNEVHMKIGQRVFDIIKSNPDSFPKD